MDSKNPKSPLNKRKSPREKLKLGFKAIMMSEEDPVDGEAKKSVARMQAKAEWHRRRWPRTRDPKARKGAKRVSIRVEDFLIGCEGCGQESCSHKGRTSRRNPVRARWTRCCREQRFRAEACCER